MDTHRSKVAIERWTARDWIAESSHLTGDSDIESDAVICGAMMLAALREGPRITKLARAIDQPRERLDWMFDNLRRNGVFTATKVLGSEWLEDGGGLAFCLNVNVGLGLLDRAKAIR